MKKNDQCSFYDKSEQTVIALVCALVGFATIGMITCVAFLVYIFTYLVR